MNTKKSFLSLGTPILLGAAMIFTSGCKKSNEIPAPHLQEESRMNVSHENKKIGHFNQVNLVSNSPLYHAAHVDPTLMNGWGLSFSPTGIAWVSSQRGHVSDVYNREGVTVLGPVHIPNPGLPEGGNPTGVVFNSNGADFIIPGGAARFIFAGVDGVVSAWNGTLGNHAFRKLTVPQSAFTGLTLGSTGGSNFLYAANFRQRRIDVWDRNWNPVTMPFVDPALPAGYAPYNIQNVAGLLYVTYSKVGPTGRSEAGLGKGFVDIYNSNGSLVRRLASMGTLNDPWGVALAPATFFKDEMEEDKEEAHQVTSVILIGNFGDGRINAYRSDGKFLGQLRAHHEPVTIDGLWAIVFPPPTSTIDPNRLYFAAGPRDEADGLFGYLIPDTDPDADDD